MLKHLQIYLRLLREAASFAVSALAVNRLRTFLSLLSISIGIFLIISVFTLVDSLESSLRGAFSSLGDDSVFIERMPWGPEPGDDTYAWWKYMKRPNVTLSEYDELHERLQAVGSMAFFASAQRTVEYRSSSAEDVDLVAVHGDYQQFVSVSIGSGRSFSPMELSGNSRVCVLGFDIAAQLFPQGQALGREVTIAGYRATVIGVLAKKGQSLFGSGTDSWVLVPVSLGRLLMDFDNSNTQIALRPAPGIDFGAALNEALMVMRSIRSLRPAEDKNFALNQSSMISKSVDEIFGVLNVVGLIIGGFSILVGGFSIANIMFVSVRERTPLIGIQKALGAKRSFILFQFLFESVTLCLIGGLAGLLVIYAGTLIASAGVGFDLTLTWANILVGIAFSIAIGLISGVVPASLAARMEPVEAMRTSV